MKGREVVELLNRDSSISPSVKKVLFALAERQSHQAKEIMELARLIDMVAQLVGQMMTIGENLKSATEAIQKQRGVGVESIPNDQDD